MPGASRHMVLRVQQLLDTAPDALLEDFHKKLRPYKRRQVTQDNCRLLQLPGALLEEIIYHTLPDPTSGHFFLDEQKLPALLHTCHHLRNTSAKVFFLTNKWNFAIHRRGANGCAVYQLDPEHKKLIRRVWLNELQGPVRHTAKASTEVASKLDESTGVTAGTWFVPSALPASGWNWVNALGEMD